MENEDVIREQMEDTRTSLSEKLETLEKQVASTVQGATTNVAETVEAVKDTVTKVTDTVQDTVATVKESVHDGVTAVKECFDIPALVRAHPWAMFAGAVAVGAVLENLLVPPAAGRDQLRGVRVKTMLPPDHYTGEDRVPVTERPPSRFSKLLKAFEPEIQRLKALAVGAAMNSMRDMAVQAAPPHLTGPVREFFNDVTRKLGGELFNEKTAANQANGKHAENGASPM